MTTKNKLFSPSQRSNTVEIVVEFSVAHPAVLGTLLVGSGANGFYDEYSDADMLIVTQPAHIVEVKKLFISWLKSKLHPTFITQYQHRDDVYIVCSLLPNFLELDVGFWSIDSLFATKPQWKLLYSRSATDRAEIEHALISHPPAHRNYEPHIIGDNPLWQIIFGRYIAELRQDVQKINYYDSLINQELKNSPNLRAKLEELYDKRGVEQLLLLAK